MPNRPLPPITPTALPADHPDRAILQPADQPTAPERRTADRRTASPCRVDESRAADPAPNPFVDTFPLDAMLITTAVLLLVALALTAW